MHRGVIDRGRKDLSAPHFRLAPSRQGLVCCPRAPACTRGCTGICTSLQLLSAADAMYVRTYIRRVPRHASLRQRINSIPADKSAVAVLSETRRSAYGPYPAIGRPQFNHASLESVPSGKARTNAGRNFNVDQSQARMTKRAGKNPNWRITNVIIKEEWWSH